MNIRIYIGFLLLTGLQAYGQEVWNWKQCVNYALGNNLDIRNEELQTKKESIRYRQSKNERYPSLSAHSRIYASFGKSVDQSTYDIVFEQNLYNSYGISTSVKIFNGFMQRNRIKFHKYNRMIAEENFKFRKNNLMFEVLAAFIEKALYEELKEILISQKEISRKEFEKALKMHELGRKSYADVLEIKAQLASDRFLLLQNKRTIEQANFRLKELMNYPVDKELIIQKPANTELWINKLSADPHSGSLSSSDSASNLAPTDRYLNDPLSDSVISAVSTDSTIIQHAKSFLPEIKMLEYRLQASEKSLALAKSNLYPSLNLSAGMGTDYYEKVSDTNTQPFRDQLQENLSESVGLSLSIPIFHKWYNRNNLKLSEVDIAIVKNEQEKMLISIENEIKYAMVELSTAESGYMSAMNQYNARVEAYKAAFKKLEKGLIDPIAFNLVKNRMANAEVELLRTSLELFLKMKRLEFFIRGNIL